MIVWYNNMILYYNVLFIIICNYNIITITCSNDYYELYYIIWFNKIILYTRNI